MDGYGASGMVSNTSFDSETKLPGVHTPCVLRKIGRYIPPHERQVQSESVLRKLQRV